MPIVEVVLDLVSELRLPTHDGHGAIIRFRLHSKMLGRMLEDSETLESANVPEGDEILIAPVVVAGGFPDVAHIFEAIATAMASGVVGNVAYDAIKGVVKRVKTRVKNKTECSPAPFDIEMLGFAAVVSRCNALGWSLPDPPELKVVHVIEKQFSDGTMYQLTIVCKEPDLRATVILHKEQISSFGAAVMLERS
jgi:hypothetical protein